MPPSAGGARPPTSAGGARPLSAGGATSAKGLVPRLFVVSLIAVALLVVVTPLSIKGLTCERRQHSIGRGAASFGSSSGSNISSSSDAAIGTGSSSSSSFISGVIGGFGSGSSASTGAAAPAAPAGSAIGSIKRNEDAADEVEDERQQVSSHFVFRYIVDDAAAALGAALSEHGADTALVLNCPPLAPPAELAALAAAGVKAECVAADGATAARQVASAAEAGDDAAVVLMSRPVGGALSLGDALRIAALPEAAVAELHSNATGAVTRAAFYDRTSGERHVWFRSTRVFLDTFNRIYAQKIWGTAGGGSGDGSTLAYTANVRAALPGIIKRYNVTSMLDSSCGSMLWMPLVLEEVERDQPGFRFHGSDVVCPLIANHTTTFAHKANYAFSCIDYANQRLPAGYDLVWSRDSLQHVPLHAAWQFLNNVRASGARYLLVGSYVKDAAPNRDIAGGDYYPIDLTKPPFNMRPAPLEVVDEKSADGKHMLLFDVAEMEWDDPLAYLPA